MARREKVKGPSGRLASALAGGNHGGARVEARRVLADAAAGDVDRAEAARVLASLGPERAAAICGAICGVVALGLAAWVVTRG